MGGAGGESLPPLEAPEGAGQQAHSGDSDAGELHEPGAAVTLFLHVARRALFAFIGSLVAVVGLFLVVDFAENASVFRGEGWIAAVLALYANRSAVVAYQIAPAAMLLAAAITASDLRRT